MEVEYLRTKRVRDEQPFSGAKYYCGFSNACLAISSKLPVECSSDTYLPVTILFVIEAVDLESFASYQLLPHIYQDSPCIRGGALVADSSRLLVGPFPYYRI